MFKRIIGFIGAEILYSFEQACIYVIDVFIGTPGRPEPEHVRQSRIQAAYNRKFAEVLSACKCEKCSGTIKQY